MNHYCIENILTNVLGGISGVITLKEKQTVIKLYLEGISEREISRRTNKARNTVRKYIKKY